MEHFRAYLLAATLQQQVLDQITHILNHNQITVPMSMLLTTSDLNTRVLILMNQRHYVIDPMGTRQYLDLDMSAWQMVHDAVNELCIRQRLDLAQELLAAAAPTRMQTLNAYLQYWIQLQGAPNDSTDNPDEAAAPDGEYTDNFAAPETNAANNSSPSQSFLHDPQSAAYADQLPAAPPLYQPSATLPFSIDPSLDDSTSMARRSGRAASQAATPTIGTRPATARAAILASDKKKQKKKQKPATGKTPTGVKKTSGPRKAPQSIGGLRIQGGNKTAVSQRWGPSSAGPGRRWTCPKRNNTIDPCSNYCERRNDMSAHVRRSHPELGANWGQGVNDWFGCGPVTTDYLRRNGATRRFAEDKETDPAEADGAEEEEDEDEEDNEDEDECGGGDIPSDGDLPDDDNDRDDGKGHGHADAQLVAVC